MYNFNVGRSIDRFKCNMMCSLLSVSYDMLHLFAGRHTHPNDRIVNKEKTKTTNKNLFDEEVDEKETEMCCF